MFLISFFVFIGIIYLLSKETYVDTKLSLEGQAEARKTGKLYYQDGTKQRLTANRQEVYVHVNYLGDYVIDDMNGKTLYNFSQKTRAFKNDYSYKFAIDNGYETYPMWFNKATREALGWNANLKSPVLIERSTGRPINFYGSRIEYLDFGKDYYYRYRGTDTKPAYGEISKDKLDKYVPINVLYNDETFCRLLHDKGENWHDDWSI